MELHLPFNSDNRLIAVLDVPNNEAMSWVGSGEEHLVASENFEFEDPKGEYAEYIWNGERFIHDPVESE